MTWLDDCRPKRHLNIDPGGKEFWDRLVNSLNGDTFVKSVDPDKGKAIILSRPVQARTREWSQYVDEAKERRDRVAVNTLKHDLPRNFYKMLADPDALEAGGTTDDVKRLRAIAQVMKDELGEINNTWLAQIMEACTGIPYYRGKVKRHTREMK